MGDEYCGKCGGLHYGTPRNYCPFETKEEETSMEMQVSREMPKYRCHKEVWALKIKAITFDVDTRKEDEEMDGTATITPEEEGYAPFKVDHAFVVKHLYGMKTPQIVGGYYVVYKDGYKSFSPAEAFEDGYTKL